MSKKDWSKGKRDMMDEVSSVGPSEAGTDILVRRRIKYGHPAQVVWGLFSEYSANSTIHGVRYLGERRRPFVERLFWITVFVLSIYGCGRLIYNVYQKWDQSPVIVSFAEKSTPVWQIPFPAVTICPETKTKSEFLNFTEAYHAAQNGSIEFEEEENARLASIAQVCDSHLFLGTGLGKNFTDSVIVEKLRQMAPSFDEMLMVCKWHNIALYSCHDLFTEVLTEEGVCYSFNVLEAEEMFRMESIQTDYEYMSSNNSRNSTDWTLEGGYSGKNTDPYPRRVLGAGARAGLFILLRLYEYDLDYICRGPVQGFKILLHTPGEIPSVSKQYFRVPLNQEVVVSVRPNMITTSEGLKHYAPNRRQCFFNEERYLRYFKVYTQQNCELECLANFTLSQCGCVKFSMPRDDTTPICGAASIECYNLAEDKLLEQEYREGLTDTEKNVRGVTSCNCLPACTSIVYEAELSQANFDWVNMFHAYGASFDEFPGIQMSRLSIFFKETQFITSKRSELYGLTDFLANCGGLLGLFMGISILSLVEIVYYCSIRLMCNLGMRKRRASKRVAAAGHLKPNIMITGDKDEGNITD